MTTEKREPGQAYMDLLADERDEAKAALAACEAERDEAREERDLFHDRLTEARADAERLAEALASINRYVSWCNHGEADRGTTLDKIDQIASAALAAHEEVKRADA